ncbi:MAG: porin family protein [Ginsengibacter sp.]
MKNKILLIISVFISSFCLAQTTPTFGVRAGITSSGIRGDASSNLNNLLDLTNGKISTTDHNGFFVGMNSNIPVSDNFSIEPGIYYSQKGYELNGNFNLKGLDFLGTKAKAALLSQYIDMPVLLKANLGGFQIFAGPQISYLTSANLKTTAGVFGINLLNKTIDATSQFNRWDAGVTGGIGYQFSNGFNLMASYDYGLQKIDANKNVSAFNRAIKLGIGIHF